jgi:hypothetical protein
LPSEAKALKICGIYGTASAVPFLGNSFRPAAIARLVVEVLPPLVV